MKKQTGFTIVELLIVIVVIAILATISVVAYNGIRERANVSTNQADLSALQKKAEVFKIDNGRYPNSGSEWSQIVKEASLTQAFTQNSGKAFVFCYEAAGGFYSVVAAFSGHYALHGEEVYYVGHNQTAIGTYTNDTSVPGTYSTQKACYQTVGPTYSTYWSYQLPQ